MARLSAHGSTIGQIDYASYSIRYMSDGHVLKNTGFGWKIYKKVKSEVNPNRAFLNAVERQRTALEKAPHYAAFRDYMINVCSLTNRSRVYTLISLMPDDPDGVWSELTDYSFNAIHIDLDDIVKLCYLYKNCINEKSA